MACQTNLWANSATNCFSKGYLSFGMVPIASSRLIDLWSSNINRQIHKPACRKLRFTSSTDFKHYIEKAKNGEFDVLAAPAHIASYLINTANFKPVAFLIWESSYLYVVKNDSHISAIHHKDAQRFALPDAVSEASILAQAETNINDKQNNPDFSHYQHYNQIVKAVVNNQADIGVVLRPFYNAYKQRTKMKIQAIHESPFPSHGMLIAAPHTSNTDQAELFNALASLDPNSDLFWQSFEAVSPSQLEQFHHQQTPSVHTLKQLLKPD